MQPNTFLIEEYKEIGLNLRNISNLQFAQITVLIAFSGGLNTLLRNTSSEPTDLFIRMTGIILVLLFITMNERVIAHWRCYWRRAIEIEVILGFKQYTIRPPITLFTQTNAVRVLHLLLICYWIVSIYYPNIGTNNLSL